MDSEGRITAIGKTIAPYEAVDCGAFLATPELSLATRCHCRGQIRQSVRRHAASCRCRARRHHDIEDAWWDGVDDPRAHALAEELAPWHLARTFAEIGVPAEGQ